MPVGRNKAGQFIKGYSGNPSGRPSPERAEIKEIFRAAAPDIARELVNLALHSKSEAIRNDAGNRILDRIYGKARESVSMDVSGGLDVRAQIRNILMEQINEQSGIEDVNNE